MDALGLLVLPFAASVAFVAIHAYLGIHVLRRNIVFADLALAQLSALGATAAFALGHSSASAAAYGYALACTFLGAAMLAVSRRFGRAMSQEAFVGILYVAASAATILVVDRAPQGAEHVKKMLIGSILTVGADDLARIVVLYGAIGLVHWIFRRPLLALSAGTPTAARAPARVLLWDLFFFASFGIVVTSSVAIAGVLLVFTFLIVPAVIGSLFSGEMRRALPIAWGVGILASAAGLAASSELDLPTGAAMVAAFAVALALSALLRALVFAAPPQRRKGARRAAAAAAGSALGLVLASSLWLIVNPSADQPLLAAFERTSGLGPGYFLATSDRAAYASALRDAGRFQAEVDRLNGQERAARYQDAPLADEEIRRLASYQQSFNEMVQGERFVQQVLRAKARARERWLLGLPAAALSGLGLALLGTWLVRRRHA